MHIAQFVHRYPPALGGAEAYTARLCEYLAEKGDNVRVWTTTAIELDEMWQKRKSPSRSGALESNRRVAFARLNETVGRRGDIEIHRYKPLGFPLRRYLLKAASLVPIRHWQCLTTPCSPICPEMWQDAQNYDGPLDAVHATAFPYSFPIACALRLARRRNVPLYITPFLHLGDPTNPDDRMRRQYTAKHLRWLLQQADGVFTQTRAEREQVLSVGIPHSHVHLQRLGVEPAECTGGDRLAARQSWNIAPQECVVGHLANNSIEKGTVDLLRAARRAWTSGSVFQVVLAGPEMPNFHAFWRDFPYKDRVIRLGVLTDQEKRNFFSAIDVFALPSRTDSFGLVLLEAWANGKPNLVYRAGGPGEIVRDGSDGLVARCGDVEQLSRQLVLLVEDSDLKRKLGANGFARIGKEFRWGDKLALVREVLRKGDRTSSQQMSSLQLQDDEVHVAVRSENL